MNFRELESNFKKNVFRNEDDIKIHFLIEFWLFRHKNLFYQITLFHISGEIFDSRTRRLIYHVIYA